MNPSMQAPVVIVGGGLSGLCCARVLKQQGIPFQILEANHRLGGRVWTDEEDGFRLDRGFQVLLTSYPEAAAVLDYNRLRLGRFESGALIRYQGRFQRFSDPWRQPKHLWSTVFSPVASWGDKIRVGKLRAVLSRGEADAIFTRPETSTYERLKQDGFSPRIIEHFFRPFFKGVFLEDELSTSSRKFEYLFRLFSCGQAALPAGGMHRIVDQLAEPLTSQEVRLNTSVVSLSGGRLNLQSGEQLTAARVVIATDPWNASRLLGEAPPRSGNHAAVAYFVASRPPLTDPILVINGDEPGPINSLCIPSQVAEDYAPAGQSLISVSLKVSQGPEGQFVQPAESEILGQLSAWYGDQVQQWRHLKTSVVFNALPIQPQIQGIPCSPGKMIRPDGTVVCGDYMDVASIQGAMRSGRLAAEAIQASMQPT